MANILALLLYIIIVGFAIAIAWQLVQPDDGSYDLETDIMALLDDLDERREQ